MRYRTLIEFLILGLWLAIAVVIFIHYNKETDTGPAPLPNIPITESGLEKGKKFDVKKITVLRGDSFDLTMTDDARVLGKLPVMATENAKAKVLDLLNHSTNPKVLLREKQPDGRWVIDLFFTFEGKEINLTEWLSSNKLVYK
jgi:hypothetical protein